MDKMHENMMKNFGSMRDPFKDDPFFNGKGDGALMPFGGGFGGGFGKMFENAHKMMDNMRKEMDVNFS